MPDFAVLAWQPLLRPPLPDQQPPEVPRSPLKALSCRNAHTSLTALVTAPRPVAGARLAVSDLVGEHAALPGSGLRIRLVGTVPTPEAGPVCDPLYDADAFSIDRCAALLITAHVPRGVPAGTYRGTVSLQLDGAEAARNDIEVEVADVTLPDLHEWNFFLNVWMNPGAVSRRAGANVWSDEHFELLRPYVRDLSEHGQKTVVAPICYQPWGTQTHEPYPNLVRWTKRGGEFEFDFSAFDRYVRLHEEHGIDRAIHCYSIVQGPGATDSSVIEYTDAGSGRQVLLETRVGDPEWQQAWGAFFDAFSSHLDGRGWLDKAYIGFDEKPDEVMDRLLAFTAERAPGFRTALAGNIGDHLAGRLDDLCLHVGFDERGVAQPAPAERSAMGVADLLDPDNVCSVSRRCPDKTLTTFYVCCGPAFPNTFVHSPLVESRMLPYLSIQGGYDGFLRWSYNDWPEDIYRHPEYGRWPTGDTFFVYPGENGPVSSLRWEQLREGIQDYELAMMASANIHDPEQMVDYEQAISLACRNVDGRTKSIGDIEIARRLLIPIAAGRAGQ